MPVNTMALRTITIAQLLAIAASSEAAMQTHPPALTPDIAYQCPDGTQLHVVSCYDASDSAACGVEQLHLPLRNGFQVRTTETRGQLARRLQACEARIAFIDAQGFVSLGAPLKMAAAHSAALVPAIRVPGTKGAAVAASDWGEVSYMFTGGETRITKIGSMSVEYAFTGGETRLTYFGYR